MTMGNHGLLFLRFCKDKSTVYVAVVVVVIRGGTKMNKANSQQKPMKRIFKYVWRHKLLLIIPSLAMLAGILLEMINPYIAKVMVDRVLTNGETNLLTVILLGTLGIAVSKSILGYIKEYLFDDLSMRVNKDLKEDLFNHIQSLPYSYFDNTNTGTLMSRIGEDVDNIWRTISFGMRLFVENIINFAIASAILFYLNWKLTLICISVMPLIAYLAMQLEKKVDKTFDKLSDQGALLNTAAQENIAGVRLVKAFAREKHEILKFLKLNDKNYELNMEQAGVFAKYYPPIEFLTNVSIILMIAVGGIFVVKGNITLGTLVAFYGYIYSLIWPMRMLGWLTNMIAQNNASAKKIFAIMDTEPEIKDNYDAYDLNNFTGHVEFKNVSFKYNDEYVLKNIDINAKPGSTVAVMGTTGSGKSSIVNLIGRYYDVTEGEILLDGMNIKDLRLKDFRSEMAVVAQDTFLFSDSIEQNIRFSKPTATAEEIDKACSDACALEFIDELEERYETVIGERGIGLSGGQKQRLSIARALIRDCKILVLDDATSALDMDTEYNLLKNLNNRDKKATTFIIAHRISAVKNADQILFVDNGEIVERGTHEDLLKLEGRYYEVYCEQFKDFDSIVQEEVI